MVSFIVVFMNALLKAVMFSVLLGVAISVFIVLPIYLLYKLIYGDIGTKRYYYKRFLEVLEERDLHKYTLPKMSCKQIINFFEIPEVKVEGCLMDSAVATYADKDDDGVLVLFVRKGDYLNPITMWINNHREREKDGIILFVPKSYRDYKKLYNYFYNKGKKQKEDELTNAQLKSLQYLKGQIHKAQYNGRKTLENCQKENADITERIKSENTESAYLTHLLNSDTATEEEILHVINFCVRTGLHNPGDEILSKLSEKATEIAHRKITNTDVEEKENPMKFVETKPLPTKTENDYTNCVLREKLIIYKEKF